MNKTVDDILEDLEALQKDLENRIEQAEDTESFEKLEKMSLELMKVKNAIVALKPIVEVY